MKTKKKIILLSCMIALLVVTAVFNFIMTSGTIDNSDTDVIASANYFENYRLERLENRNEELLQLDSVISSSETNSVEYSEALAKKTNIALLSEKEMLCETLIKAYGFEDAVVVNIDGGQYSRTYGPIDISLYSEIVKALETVSLSNSVQQITK